MSDLLPAIVVLAFFGSIVSFVVSIINAIRKRNSKKPRTIGLVLLAVTIVAFIGFAVSTPTAEKETNTNQDKKYIDIVKEVAEKELKNKADNIEVTESYYDGENIAIHYLVKESVWDSSDFVRTAFTHYVNICRELYDRKDAIDIYFNVDGVIVDGKGNEETRTLIYLVMPKDKFATYNWDNLKMTNLDFEMVKNDCKIFNIKRPISNDFDETKFYYTGK